MVMTGGPGLAFCVGAGVVEVAFPSDCLSASGLAFDTAAGVSLRDNPDLLAARFLQLSHLKRKILSENHTILHFKAQNPS